MMQEEGKYITVKQAAKQLYLSESRVRQLLRAGKITGHKFASERKWLIAADEVARTVGHSLGGVHKIRGEDTNRKDHVAAAQAGQAHFTDVRGYIQTWYNHLAARPLLDLIDDVACGRFPRYLAYEVEGEAFFPLLQGHLMEPVVESGFWRQLGEVKAEGLVTHMRRLWDDMQEDAQKQTGLMLSPSWGSEPPTEGLTIDFVQAIWWTTLGVPALKEAEYHRGSVSYLEDSVVWAPVEEGEARLAGRKTGGAVPPTLVYHGSSHVSSKDARVIQAGRPPVAGRQEVRFFLRYGHLELAFVRSPGELAKLQTVHQKIGAAYQRQIAELADKHDAMGAVLGPFKKRLRNAALFTVFPGKCKYCPRT